MTISPVLENSLHEGLVIRLVNAVEGSGLYVAIADDYIACVIKAFLHEGLIIRLMNAFK